MICPFVFGKGDRDSKLVPYCVRYWETLFVKHVSAVEHYHIEGLGCIWEKEK